MISTHDLTRVFGSTRAVDGLSLQVPAGAVFGLLGPNGSGKTTTIRLLIGLLRPTHGRAEVLGYDTATDAARVRESVGVLLEHTGLYERLTARENLEFHSRVWRLAAEARRARIRELLEHFDLYGRCDERVAVWSRGMKQKLAVARALLHEPPLVFLDEPTAGLDPGAAASLRRDLLALAARTGTTVFLTTHNLAEAQQLCGVVGIVRKGRLVASGPPHALVAGRERRLRIQGRGFGEAVLRGLRALPEVEGVSVVERGLVVDLRDGADTARIVRTVVEAGGGVEAVEEPTRSLESAYLELMDGDR